MKYYDLSDHWKRGLLPIERERLEIVKRILPGDARTILDAGCGNGAISNYLPSTIDITGVDFSEEALKYFKRKKVVSNLQKLPFAAKSFDLVLCSDVLEHIVPDLFDKVVAELKRVSKKYLLVISPHAENLESGKVRCYRCGAIFHMNWHVRSLHINNLKKMFSDSYHLQAFTFFGDPWKTEPGEITAVKQALSGKLTTWTRAVCPLCNSVQDEDAVPLFDASGIESWIRNGSPADKDPIKHSEVAVLFSRQKKSLVLDSRDLPALFIDGKAADDENPSLAAGSCMDLPVGSPLFVRETSCYNPELPYVVKNTNMDWGEAAEIDEKTARLYENARGKDCHAVMVFPVPDQKPRSIAVEFKDTTTEEVLLEVYDPGKGYRAVGKIAGEGDGQWKTKQFDFPDGIKASQEGFIFHFRVEGGRHPKRALPIARIYAYNKDDQNPASTPLTRIGKRENLWVLPKAQYASDTRVFVKFPLRLASCNAYIITREKEYYFLGPASSGVLVPNWIFDARLPASAQPKSASLAEALGRYINHLEGRGEQGRREIQKLEGRITELEQAVVREAGNHSVRIKELESARQAAVWDKENLDARLKEREGEKQQLVWDKENLAAKVRELEGELAGQKQQAEWQRENLEAKVKELSEIRQSLIWETQNQGEKIREIESEKQEIIWARENLEARLKELEGEKQQSVRDKEGLAAKVKELEGELAGQKKQAQRDSDNLTAKIKELEGERQAAVRDKENLDARLKEREGEKQQLVRDKENLAAKVKELEDELAGHKQQATRDIENLAVKVQELDAIRQSMDREIRSLSEEGKISASTNQTLTKENETLVLQLHQKKQDLDKILNNPMINLLLRMLGVSPQLSQSKTENKGD